MTLKALYLDPGFEKQLRLLRRAGKKAAMAADKAGKIIARLRGGESVPEKIGSMTRHGERRIKGVVKYDLGGGYRLVSYKQRFRIFLLYVGTHDDCHRWIENNRELTIDQIKIRCSKLAVEAGSIICDMTGNAAAPETEKENHDPLDNLTDKELRLVFRGLVDAS